jgi:hypothetical protein
LSELSCAAVQAFNRLFQAFDGGRFDHLLSPIRYSTSFCGANALGPSWRRRKWGQRSRRHGPLLYLFAANILAAPNFNLGLSAPIGDSDSDREAT